MANIAELQLGKKQPEKAWQPDETERKMIRNFEDDMDIAIYI